MEVENSQVLQTFPVAIESLVILMKKSYQLINKRTLLFNWRAR